MNKHITVFAFFIICITLACSTLFPKTQNVRNETIQPTAMTANNANSECTQFNLTPEECANAGTHEYSLSEKVTYIGTPTLCEPTNYSDSYTFLFSDENNLKKINSIGGFVDFKRVNRNSFAGRRVQRNGEEYFTVTLTFNLYGYDTEESAFRVENNFHDCTWVTQALLR